MKDRVRHFTQGQIEKIAKIIGDTSNGLTGSEISHILVSAKLKDTDPGVTKWRRLYNAFVHAHNTEGNDNYLLSFISKALEPSRFSGGTERYRSILRNLNVILSFQGLEFRDDGKFHKIKKISSLCEAEKRVCSLKKTVEERNLHPELLRFCQKELLEDNYFHAVLEAVKGVFSLIRDKTGLTGDGAVLIDFSYGGDNPKLIINKWETESEKSEQKGFVNLLKGLYGTFRSPTAHASRIEWEMKEQDALDLFTMASYVYRRVVNSIRYNQY